MIPSVFQQTSVYSMSFVSSASDARQVWIFGSESGLSPEKQHIPTAEAMEALGGSLALSAQPGDIIFLIGNLGAGKTTLVRGFLRKLGHLGTVKSPTYTLVESYEGLSSPNFENLTIHHFDLYRLKDPNDLLSLGLVDYCHDKSICLFEWPDLLAGHLKATCRVEIEI